jgi:hypothetical protein
LNFGRQLSNGARFRRNATACNFSIKQHILRFDHVQSDSIQFYYSKQLTYPSHPTPHLKPTATLLLHARMAHREQEQAQFRLDVNNSSQTRWSQGENSREHRDVNAL